MGDTTVTGPMGTPISVPSPSGSDCVNGYDQYGVACQDFTPITSNPVETALANFFLNTPTPAAKPATSMPSWAIPAIAGGILFLLVMAGGRR